MIKKAIIPVAWMWTRFLPATKAQPKEMLPIVDKPVIQYIVEEAVNSWIEEIIFVTGSSKRAIEDHFDSNFELNYNLEKKWKTNILKEIKKLEKVAKITYVRQPESLGDWHAILCAKHCISKWEDFAVLFWDDIIDNDENPWLKQLISAYEKTKTSIIWVNKIIWKDIEKYWVIKCDKFEDKITQINWLIEKPSFENAPSNFWIIWKYICNYDIFDSIEKWKKSEDWELRLIDWFLDLMKKQKVFAKIIEWKRFDTWSKSWWLMANIFYALKRWWNLSSELKKYLFSLNLK